MDSADERLCRRLTSVARNDGREAAGGWSSTLPSFPTSFIGNPGCCGLGFVGAREAGDGFRGRTTVPSLNVGGAE